MSITLKQILLSGNHRELAAMIKGIFEVGQVRKGKGNRLAVRDEENMKRAQKLLYGRVSPFRHLRVTGYLLLTAAFRSL